MGDAIIVRAGQAAVNVKVHAHIPVPEDVPDDVCEAVWDRTVSQFWADVVVLAHRRGYATVFAEGRSGGWCVPFYQRDSQGRTQFERWPGQGPDHGYPWYPDVKQPGEREKFRAFQRDVRRLLDEAKKAYAADCAAALTETDRTQ